MSYSSVVYLFVLNLLIIQHKINGQGSIYSSHQVGSRSVSLSKVNGYHFHTLFMQNNPVSVREVQIFRDNLLALVYSRYLPECIVGSLFDRPMDEYPVGNFVTCCNSTALAWALPYFSQQHGQLSVMIHPLTRENMLDHSERAMWIGQKYPLDFSNTVPYRNPPECVPQSVP